MKFEWQETDDCLQCHVHQEAFILDIVDHHNLSLCNKSPRVTPFRSGLPVDTIHSTSLPQDQQNSLTK